MTAPDSHGEIYRLLYTSACSIAGSHQKVLAEVGRIVKAASSRNAQRALTGVLVYVNGTFIQVLEGSALDISDVFESICTDMRHDQLRLIEHARVPARLFQEWSMTLVADQEGEVDGGRASTLDQIGGVIDSDPDLAIRQVRAVLSQEPSVL